MRRKKVWICLAKLNLSLSFMGLPLHTVAITEKANHKISEDTKVEENSRNKTEAVMVVEKPFIERIVLLMANSLSVINAILGIIMRLIVRLMMEMLRHQMKVVAIVELHFIANIPLSKPLLVKHWDIQSWIVVVQNLLLVRPGGLGGVAVGDS